MELELKGTKWGRMNYKKTSKACLWVSIFSLTIMMFTSMGQDILAFTCLGIAILCPVMAIIFQIKAKDKKNKRIFIIAGLILLLIVLLVALPAISF